MPKIIINPGHFYPPDPGACGGGLREADITLKLANLIAPQLLSYGIESMIVHSNELADICEKANSSGADLFISLHVNAGKGTGYEDYTYSAGSKADTYRSMMRIEVMNYLRRLGCTDRGQKTANFAVLRDTNMPAILTENLFIDTAQDAAKLTDNTFIRGLADAYVKGIARALGCTKLPQAEQPTDAVNIQIGGKVVTGKLIDGVSYAPVRALAEALGCTVAWNEATRTVTVS